MADNAIPLLEDAPSSTPLDLLLNAISGSGQYGFADSPADDSHHPSNSKHSPGALPADGNRLRSASCDAALGDRDGDSGGELRRKRGLSPASSPRQSKVARTLSAHFAPNSLNPKAFASSDTFSTVEVWHPKTGQKSYGRERR